MTEQDNKIHCSILTRLMRVTFAIYLTVTSIVVALQLNNEYRTTMQHLRSQLAVTAQTSVPSLAGAYWQYDLKLFEDTLTSIVNDPAIYGVKVLKKDTKEIISHRGKILLNEGEHSEAESPSGTQLNPSQQNQFAKLLEHTVPLTYTDQEGDTFNLGTFTAYSSTEVAWQEVRQRFRQIILILLIQMLSLWTLSLWIGHKHLKQPFRRLTQAMDRIDLERLHDYSIDLNISERNEFKLVEDSFNAMVGRLNEAEASLRQLNTELEDRVTRRTEALARAKEAADAAARAKSQFLANMSHEIRTPMNGVVAATDLALQKEMAPELKRYMEIIQSSSQTLMGIINEILDFSKIEAGKLELEKARFDLHDLVRGVAETLALRSAQNDIELVVDIDPQLPRYFQGDALRLHQILNNLVGNAVKFTSQNGIVTILVASIDSTKPRDLSTTADVIQLHFQVTDTGIGMSEEVVRNLFRPFTQADTSTTRRFGGTGLGLTITKRLIDMMEGQIEVESKPEVGSTFRFTLPLRCDTSQDSLLPIPKEISSLNALVIEKCPAVANVLRKSLTSFGLQVRIIDNERSMMRTLDGLDHQEPIGLLIIDQNIDDALGFVTRIHQEHNSRLPALLLTSLGHEPDSDTLQAAGISGLLTKPVCASTLLNGLLGIFGETLEAEQTSAKAEENAILEANKNQVRGCRILLVEDNLINQEIAKAVLKSADIDVILAQHGKEAVDLLKHQTFHAVLMDSQMPVMDGITATRTIRSCPEYANLTIIGMSANTLAGDKEEAIAAGMNDYITKPIKQPVFFATLAKYINNDDMVEKQAATQCKGSLSA